MKKFFYRQNNLKVFFLKKVFPTILIILLASCFRFLNINWDQGQHLHPDERFLTMVGTAIKFPKNIIEYFDPQLSSMNPYNNGFGFFVYGTFPLYLVKIIALLTRNDNYANFNLVGRVISGFFDLGIIFLIIYLGKIWKNQKIGIWAAFFYSIMVLPIQLSHFFAVDTFLNFFIFFSFFALIKVISTKKNYWAVLLGISFGFALSCKISAILFLPVILLGFWFYLSETADKKKILKSLLIFGIFTYLFFRIGHPVAFKSGNFFNFSLNPKFLNNLKELKSFDNPESFFPPAIQWKSTKPIIYPLKNILFWGLGLPLGIFCFLSIFFEIYWLMREKTRNLEKEIIILSIFWIFFLLIFQGIQFAKPMRYFLLIYPFLAIIGSHFFVFIANENSYKKRGKLFLFLKMFLTVIFLIYPLSFLSIYIRPMTRIEASKWIYKNILDDSAISFEEWDDGLPLLLPDYPPKNFKVESFFMYDPDTSEKWQKINEKLKKIEYYFITSNRAYGSTMKLPNIYPQTTDFYQSLFNETGDFKKTAEFASYPCFPPFGKVRLFCFKDDSADESFTVYDHPKVIIFQKK